MAKIIGIDLGTTNSLRRDHGGRQAQGDRELAKARARRRRSSRTPKTSEILSARPAKRQAVTNAKNTALRGQAPDRAQFEEKEVQKDIDLMPYKIVKADNGDAWVEVRGKKIAPQQVSAEVLRKMKKTAEDYLGEAVTEAVITVPAYFNDSQRQATKDAGRIAGLEVKRIINEPTAAALAFGLDKQEGDRKIAVYDLGGGTFDISIIEIADVEGEHQFEVLSTNGDTFLGGEDFDQRLIDYIVTEFKKDQGVDLSKDVLALQRLKEAAEKAKIELSSVAADRDQPAVHHGRRLRARSTCDEDHAREVRVAGGRPDRSAPSSRAASRSRMRASRLSDIDDVILVGGMTRMPKVQEKVKRVLRQGAAQGREPGRGRGGRRRDPGRRAAGRREGRAAARRDAAVARHRDAGRRDDQAHQEEHHDPDQGERRCSRPPTTTRPR